MPHLSEAQLVALFERASELVLLVRANPDGSLEPAAANPAYLNFAGLDPGEEVGRPLAEVWGQGDPGLFEAKCREALEVRATLRYDEPLESRAGAPNLKLTLVPVPAESGGHVVCLGRLEVLAPPQPAGERAEQRIGSILETTHEAYVGMDSFGFITDWNTAAEELFGWRREEAIGRVLSETIIPPALRPAHERGLQRYLATGEGPVLGDRLELMGLHRDGHEVPVELTISPLRAGDGVSFHAFVHGISERKRADSYLRAQHAVSHVLATAATAQDAVPMLLQGLAESLEWETGAMWVPEGADGTLRCRHFWHAPGVEVSSFEAKTLELSFAAGEGLPGRVYATGKPAWVADVATEPNFPRSQVASACGLRGGIGLPVREDDQVLGVIEFFSSRLREPDRALLDMLESIGDQVGHFVRRREAEAELERSNAELEQFAYVASHDLTEPLRMVSGFLQLLQRRYEGRLDAEADEFIGYALQGTERMQQMITDLLAYSRVGRGELKRTTVDTREVVEETLVLLRALVEETGATVEIGELPQVEADSGQLAQLFQNLISNAIKFRTDQPPRVSISAERADNGWLFTVADNGVGVPEPDRERVFQMFQRGRAGAGYRGTGIGLAICKRIVERHGGTIRIDANEPAGTAVRFTLPSGSP